MTERAPPNGHDEPRAKASTLAPTRALPAQRVAFVGLGLVGGSLARATARAWPGVTVVGVDRAPIVDVALQTGVVKEGAPLDAADALLHDADLVVMCLPVLSITELLPKIARAAPNAVLTDTGSTKERVCEVAARAQLSRFVGGHPMAGKPHGGLAHADADLVRGAVWFLCPGASADARAVSLLRTWVNDLGGRPVEIDAAEHDRKVALTSQVPHLLANTLAEAVLDSSAADAAGGSLREVLAVAGAPIEVWGDALVTNRAALASALDDVIARLHAVRGAMDDEQALRERMRDLFAHGRACRERLRV